MVLSDDSLDVDELEETKAEPSAPAKEAAAPAKVGFFGQIGGRISGSFAGLFRPEFINLKNGGIGLAILLCVWLLLANLSPVRVLLWFWPVDVPKAIAFLVDVALGALLMWLWLRSRASRAAARAGEGSP
jgi:uncharacterized integral membrane protein